jgi:type II secretory pathway component GspD/PulD (secretin)
LRLAFSFAEPNPQPSVEPKPLALSRRHRDDITLEPVQAGITLTVLPFVLPEEQIRLDLEIIASVFVPTLENVQLVVNKSSATSTVRIGAGQTLVIVGQKQEPAPHTLENSC